MAGRPDGLEGWLVALACFGINFVMAGLGRTVGVLYVAIIELYGVTREMATTPFSIRVCVRNLVSPVVGVLGQKYGLRGVTTAGLVVAAVGTVCCSFAPSVTWIIVFWGVLNGIGFGMSTVIHMTVIGQYFDKYKASALGFGYAGDCCGSFVFPLIMEYLVSHFDMSGTFLIMGGIILNVVPMALCLKKPSWIDDDNNTETKILKHICRNNDIGKQSGLSYDNEGFYVSEKDESCDQVKKGKSCPESLSNHMANNRKLELHYCAKSGVDIHNLDRISPIGESSNSTDLLANASRPSIGNNISNKFLPPVPGTELKTLKTTSIVYHSDQNRKDFLVDSKCIAKDQNKHSTITYDNQSVQIDSACCIEPDLLVDEVLDLRNGIGQSRRLPERSEKTKSNIKISNASSENRNFELQLALNNPNPISVKKGTTDGKRLLNILIRTNCNPIFILISLTLAAFGYVIVTIITVIIDYASDQGVPQDRAKYLVIGFSLADLLGRLSLGQVLDRNLLSLKNYACLFMLLMGLFTCTFPLHGSFHYMMAVVCMVGLTQGGTSFMFPMLINKYLRKDEETIAMGSMNFHGGILLLSIAPLIGLFRDRFGSYRGVFYIAGGAAVAVGLAWQAEPLLLRKHTHQLHK